jgi:hypothetical protein
VKCSALADIGTAGAPLSATVRINGSPSSVALRFGDGARSDVEERASFWFCVSHDSVILFEAMTCLKFMFMSLQAAQRCVPVFVCTVYRLVGK